MAVSDIANDLAVLVGVAEWTWTESTTYATFPSDGAAGVLLANGGANFSGSPRAATWVRMWSAGRLLGRTATLSFTHDATSTYSLSTGARGPYTSTTPADLNTLLTDIESAINADGSKIVTVSVVGTTLEIVGNGDDPGYFISVSVSGGAGTISVATEPTQATISGVVSPGTYGAGNPPDAASWIPVPDVNGNASALLSGTTPESLMVYPVGGFGRFAMYASGLSAADTAGSGATISYTLGDARVAVSTLP